MIENLILIAVLAAILFFAGRYVYKAKKSGRRCVGCPDGGSCPHCAHHGGKKR